jgi:hypothetical protein
VHYTLVSGDTHLDLSEKNLGALPERIRRKIVCDNVVELYYLG